MALCLGGSWAAPAAGSKPHEYSRYELDVIAAELARHGGILDPAPEGKRIVGVEFARLDVFDDRDPMPDFVNFFHTRSRERVIRRELLFREGERWQQRRIDETARNLRTLRQLSLVLIVPIKDEADQVRALVITKDVWSLRLNSDFEIANGRLNSLTVSPSEENVFGTHARIAGLFTLARDTYSFGGYAAHDRILGSRLRGLVSYSVVLNRDSNEREGFVGNFSYGLPLYTEDQRWAFDTGVVFKDYLVREYARGGGIARFDADATPFHDNILYVYSMQQYVAGSQVTRSFGRELKADVTFGLEADRQTYRLRVPPLADPRAAAEFEAEELPRSDQRMGPFATFESYENHFLKTRELETLGLAEDIRIGHTSVVRFFAASRELGSTRDIFGVFTGAGYTLPIGNGLVRGIVTSQIDAAGDDQSDARAGVSLRVASPRLGFGRVILDGILQNRYQNYSNKKYAIGGADRLRGYPTDDPTLRGDDALALNAEFRSAGVNLLSVELGAAAFYDLGGAADSPRRIALRQSTGVGLRMMFPEFDRVVLRADWGFPLSPGYRSFPGGFFFTFEQAFPLSGLSAPSAVKDAL